jgi:putative ABC transport system ATP-binding protein
MSEQQAAIMLRAVSKTYKVGREPLHAVRDASFDVAQGELVAIIGPSGSGKTTLTHMLGGLLKPDSGRIAIAGTELSRLSDRKLSRFRNKHIGFIFQNFSLLPGYSALENVCVPLIVAGLSPAERKRRATHYLALMGLQQQMHQKAEELSGGQRQRVAIARALAMHPSVVIADEPTGSLDSARGHEIMNILTHLAHEQNMSVIMVTHDLQLAAQADRQIHILDGTITEHTHARA